MPSDDEKPKFDLETPNTNEKIIYCSFCGKSQHEVRKVIAGPTVFICDECVELCGDILNEERINVKLRQSDLLGDGISDRVSERLNSIAPGNEAFRKRILSDAIGSMKLQLANKSTINNIRMLFIGPRGCDIPLILDTMWQIMGMTVIRFDASNLREGSFQGQQNLMLKVLQSNEYNVEKAQSNSVIILENLDRVFKSTEEFQRIQEDLEVAINGTFVSVPPQGGRRQIHHEGLNFDTGRLKFFATTSLLHENALPIVCSSKVAVNRHGDMRVARQELIVRGMHPGLLNAFDDIVEYDPITTDEVIAFLGSQRSEHLLGELTALNIRLDSEAVLKIIDLLIDRGEGMKSLRSIINLIAMRVAFSQDHTNDSDEVTAKWLESNI